MANLQHNGRWVLDTAESVVAAGTSVRIMSVWFEGGGDAGECILHDGGGKVIWQATLGDVSVSGDNAGHVFGGNGQIVDGLDLDTLTAGVCIVYLGKL